MRAIGKGEKGSYRNVVSRVVAWHTKSIFVSLSSLQFGNSIRDRVIDQALIEAVIAPEKDWNLGLSSQERLSFSSTAHSVKHPDTQRGSVMVPLPIRTKRSSMKRHSISARRWCDNTPNMNSFLGFDVGSEKGAHCVAHGSQLTCTICDIPIMGNYESSQSHSVIVSIEQ